MIVHLPAKRSVIDLAIPGRFPRNRWPCRTAVTATGLGNLRSANAHLIGKFRKFILTVNRSGYFHSECAFDVFDIDISLVPHTSNQGWAFGST